MPAFDRSVRGGSAARPGERANPAGRSPAKCNAATRRDGQLARGDPIAGRQRSIELVGGARQFWRAKCDARSKQRRGGVNQRRRGQLRLFKLGCRKRKFRMESATRRNLARGIGILCNHARQIDEQTGERGVCSLRIAELYGPDRGIRDQAHPYAARSCRGLARIARRACRRRNALGRIERGIESFPRRYLGTHHYEAGRHGSSQSNQHTEPRQDKHWHRNKAFRVRIDDAGFVRLQALNQEFK